MKLSCTQLNYCRYLKQTYLLIFEQFEAYPKDFENILQCLCALDWTKRQYKRFLESFKTTPRGSNAFLKPLASRTLKGKLKKLQEVDTLIFDDDYYLAKKKAFNNQAIRNFKITYERNKQSNYAQSTSFLNHIQEALQLKFVIYFANAEPLEWFDTKEQHCLDIIKSRFDQTIASYEYDSNSAIHTHKVQK